MPLLRWDIFCTVVDNFGDIGVCWRLARQLAQEHGLQLRLWVDDLASFARIQPEIDPTKAEQQCRGVKIVHWHKSLSLIEPADVVIEAFACELPADYIERMRVTRPVWINLEYLSAEDWVEGCHGLNSPQKGLAKYFFFPGFSERTGGVLGEERMQAARAQWSQADGQEFLARFAPVEPGALRVSLFAYENPALEGLLRAWSEAGRAIHVFMPEGRLLPLARSALHAPDLLPGQTIRRGALVLTCLAMLPQDDYDRLLWSCDLNFVRGEDSFIRAQWAAKPFVWHIYPQDDEAHHPKLLAFMARYVAGLEDEVAASLSAFWLAWNKGEGVAEAWPDFLATLPVLRSHAQVWASRLTAQGDLAGNLVKFVSGKVE